MSWPTVRARRLYASSGETRVANIARDLAPCSPAPQLTRDMALAIQSCCGCHARVSLSRVIEVVDGILMALTLVGVEGDGAMALGRGRDTDSCTRPLIFHHRPLAPFVPYLLSKMRISKTDIIHFQFAP
jgi:hypothetical protein